MRASDSNTQIKSPRVGTAFLLSQAGAHAAIAFGERLQVLSLKPHDAGILRILGSNPGVTQQALSQILGMFPSRLVAVLDGLERQGLIERRASPSDRRVYQLHLNAAGHAALTAIARPASLHSSKSRQVSIRRIARLVSRKPPQHMEKHLCDKPLLPRFDGTQRRMSPELSYRQKSCLRSARARSPQ